MIEQQQKHTAIKEEEERTTAEEKQQVKVEESVAAPAVVKQEDQEAPIAAPAAGIAAPAAGIGDTKEPPKAVVGKPLAPDETLLKDLATVLDRKVDQKGNPLKVGSVVQCHVEKHKAKFNLKKAEVVRCNTTSTRVRRLEGPAKGEEENTNYKQLFVVEAVTTPTTFLGCSFLVKGHT